MRSDTPWTLCSKSAEEQAAFASPAATLALKGDEINRDFMSRLVRVEMPHGAFYVKSYVQRGRWLRRWAGRSRLRTEWENLLLFRKLGLATAEVIAYGEQHQPTYSGVLVMRELAGTSDLASLSSKGSDWLHDVTWRKTVIRRLSGAVRSLHDVGFIHNDLKWRNILADLSEDPEVYIIDCPQGRRLSAPLLGRGIIKDLACLDKVARSTLSRTDRLRFYLAYKGRRRLHSTDKVEIAKVLRFFSGRE